MRPTAPSKAYTCEHCGHTGPHVIGAECHTCWMKRINKEPQLDELLPKERAMTKETTIEKGKTTTVEEEQTEQTETQPQTQDDDDGDDQGTDQ